MLVLSRRPTVTPNKYNIATHLLFLRVPTSITAILFNPFAGPPEPGYKIHRRGPFAPNLREDSDFITIPSLKSGEEVTVRHKVPVSSLHFWKKKDDGYREEVKPEQGEIWRVGHSEGGLGTFWWAWGDLEGELRDKKFGNDEWFDEEEGRSLDDEEKEAGKGEDWVYPEKENGFGLTVEVENQAEVTFV
ncbi:MAG: hypothetical protein Q9222_002473 [Ikaeria aurantiellina]